MVNAPWWKLVALSLVTLLIALLIGSWIVNTGNRRPRVFVDPVIEERARTHTPPD